MIAEHDVVEGFQRPAVGTTIHTVTGKIFAKKIPVLRLIFFVLEYTT